MSKPQLSEIARQLEQSDPDDREGLLEHLGSLRELADFVRLKHVPDLTACLDASVKVLEVAASSSKRFDGSELRDIVCSILDAVRRGAAKSRQAESEDAQGSESDSTPQPDLEVVESADTSDAGAPASSNDAETDDSPPPLEAEADGDGDSDGRLLGQLLIEMGHVKETEVADALAMHRDRGMPIGECLLLGGAITPDKLMRALRIQAQLRAEALDPEVEQAPRRKVSLPPPGAMPSELHADKGKAAMRVTRDMFIGEVLLGSEVITEGELEEAMRIHHLEKIRVGEALLRLEAVTEEELDAALELQSRLRGIAGLASNFANK